MDTSDNEDGHNCANDDIQLSKLDSWLLLPVQSCTCCSMSVWSTKTLTSNELSNLHTQIGILAAQRWSGSNTRELKHATCEVIRQLTSFPFIAQIDAMHVCRRQPAVYLSVQCSVTVVITFNWFDNQSQNHPITLGLYFGHWSLILASHFDSKTVT